MDIWMIDYYVSFPVEYASKQTSNVRQRIGVVPAEAEELELDTSNDEL